jgi:3-hydroxymyristoyl/3-hydroxydecanoyl-(acyl carrier protein) dehydratase
MRKESFTPHGPSFQFIDEREILEIGKKVRTKKWLDPELPFFKDHFPEAPLFPAVYMIEAAAQCSGCVWGSLSTDPQPTRYVVARIMQFNIKQAVYPNQTLFIESTLERDFGTLGQFQIELFVENRLVAQGIIVLSKALFAT